MNKDILAFKGFIESRYQITLENNEFLNKYLPVFKHELESWQSACEYKDKELMEWREAARSEANEVNRLQAENKKLREALKTSIEGHQFARMVLREACFHGAADDMTDYIDVTMKALKETKVVI